MVIFFLLLYQRPRALEFAIIYWRIQIAKMTD